MLGKCKGEVLKAKEVKEYLELGAKMQVESLSAMVEITRKRFSIDSI